MNNSITVNYLNEYLATLAILNTKQHNFHWNIIGPVWSNIHALTQLYYETFQASYDEVAERIKQYNAFPITNTKTYAEVSKVQDTESRDYRETEVIDITIQDFETLLTMTNNITKIAETNNDLVLIDIMTRYASFLEKQLWILKAHLK